MKSVFIDTCTTLDIEFVDPENNIRIKTDDVCDFLNKYFVEIGSKNKDQNIPATDIPNLLNGYVFDDILLPEVISLIKDIDVSKDSCLDGIITSIIKNALLAVHEKIMRLFSLSLNTGTFPRKWARGYVNILPKSGELSNPGNWRPITQTCVPSKLLEKIVHKRFMKILCDTDFLSENQYGFRKGRSTQQATFDIVNDLYHNMNSNLISG